MNVGPLHPGPIDLETGASHPDFGTNPEALAWAREHVERVAAKYRGFEATARSEGRMEMASQWRKFANLLQMELVGGKGCVITPFDERRPQILGAEAREGR